MTFRDEAYPKAVGHIDRADKDIVLMFKTSENASVRSANRSERRKERANRRKSPRLTKDPKALKRAMDAFPLLAQAAQLVEGIAEPGDVSAHSGSAPSSSEAVRPLFATIAYAACAKTLKVNLVILPNHDDANGISVNVDPNEILQFENNISKGAAAFLQFIEKAGGRPNFTLYATINPSGAFVYS